MKRKLQLNRDTIVRLTPVEIDAAHGGAPNSQDRSCLIGSCVCSFRTCNVSCGGTCFEISCAPSACTL